MKSFYFKKFTIATKQGGLNKGREQARKKFASCTHARARTRVERVVCSVSPPPLPPLLMTTAAISAR